MNLPLHPSIHQLIIHPSIPPHIYCLCPSNHPSMFPSFPPSVIHASAKSSIHVSIQPSVHPFIYLFLCLSICHSICLSFLLSYMHPSIHPSPTRLSLIHLACIHPLSIHLSIHLGICSSIIHPPTHAEVCQTYGLWPVGCISPHQSRAY